jgi:hypothetical protein
MLKEAGHMLPLCFKGLKQKLAGEEDKEEVEEDAQQLRNCFLISNVTQ